MVKTEYLSKYVRDMFGSLHKDGMGYRQKLGDKGITVGVIIWRLKKYKININCPWFVASCKISPMG